MDREIEMCEAAISLIRGQLQKAPSAAVHDYLRSKLRHYDELLNMAKITRAMLH